MVLRIKRHLAINIDINIHVLVDTLKREKNKRGAQPLISMTDFNLLKLKS